MTLPEELAPPLREAAERLIAECGEAPPRPARHQPDRLRRCWHCGEGGPLGGHHLCDGTVVLVHRSCHAKLHRRAETLTLTPPKAEPA